jgi:hypothetical protein
MTEQGTFLVSTLAVLRSFTTFGTTTRIDRFVGTEGRRWLEETREIAAESVRIAHAAGVRIAAGTDFGGGSTRANHMAWEVESLVGAGLEPYEALAAATRRGPRPPKGPSTSPRETLTRAALGCMRPSTCGKTSGLRTRGRERG